MPDDLEVLAPPADGGDAAPPEDPTPPAEEAPPEETPAEQPAEETPAEETPAEKPPEKQEELPEFKGTVSARLKELDKRAPGLAAHLNKFPQVRDAIAATFRREAAFRELYPGGLQEAAELREAFPRGMEDVKQVMSEIDEVGQIDQAFYTRDAQGNYPGHAQFIENLAKQDKDATIALLRRTPNEWHKLDPDSYNEVFGAILYQTLGQERVLEHLEVGEEIAKELKNPELNKWMASLKGWTERYSPKRAKEPTEEERRFRAEREEFARQKGERDKEETGRFQQTLHGESYKFAQNLVGAHPAIKNLPKTIPAAKKQEIITKVAKRIGAHLDKTRPFRAAFDAAYNARDIKAALEAQKQYWTGWLLNKYVRTVLAEETPGLVAGSQARPGAKPAAAAKPGNGRAAAPKAFQGPDKRWYKPDGTAFTTQEVLRGAHLQ